MMFIQLFSFTSILLFQSTSAVHRADNSKYFMFIEPDTARKLDQPIDDELTVSLQEAIDNCPQWGTSNYADLDCKGKFTPGGAYRGLHFAEDGEVSSNNDCLLQNGFITNSLCVHYVRYYRDQIPETEMKKLRDLHEYMKLHKHAGGASSFGGTVRRKYTLPAVVVATVGFMALWSSFNGQFKRMRLNPTARVVGKSSNNNKKD